MLARRRARRRVRRDPRRRRRRRRSRGSRPPTSSPAAPSRPPPRRRSPSSRRASSAASSRRDVVGGRAVDVGPDGFLARRPEAVALVARARLRRDDLEPIGASGASVSRAARSDRAPRGPRARRAHAGSASVTRSGCSGSAARCARPSTSSRPGPRGRSPLPDRAIGPLVARQARSARRRRSSSTRSSAGSTPAGSRPLGGARSSRRCSAAAPGSRQPHARAAVPPRAVAPSTATGPVFVTRSATASGAAARPRGGRARRTRRDVRDPARRRRPCGAARPAHPRWVVETADDDHAGRRRRPGHARRRSPRGCSAPTTATPPPCWGRSMPPRSRSSRFALAADDVTLPEEGTGVLVPLGHAGCAASATLVTAVTFLDRKWPHLATRRRDDAARSRRAASTTCASTELDDDELVTGSSRSCEALRAPRRDAARASLVTRWPSALPPVPGEPPRPRRGRRARRGRRSGGSPWRARRTAGSASPRAIGSGGRAAARALEPWLR